MSAERVAAGTVRAPPHDVDDEIALARSVGEGDRAAFEQLMRRHNRRLYRVARAALRDEAEAEDALQEAYLAAYRSIASFRGESSLATWLSRLVLNECLGRLRKSARRQNIVPMVAADAAEVSTVHDSADLPDAALVRTQMRDLIERKLDALPEDFRIVFVLRAVEDLSVEEAAVVLGIPEATVRSRHFRARGLLREALAREIDVAEGGLYDFGGSRCDRIVQRVAARLDETIS